MIGLAIRGQGPLEALAQALEPLRSVHEANHNYSVWLSDDRRVFHRLQWGGCTVVRTRDPQRLGRALAAHLSGHGAPPHGLARADGVLALREGRATILPSSLRQSIATYERPLRATGMILSDVPWVDVDPHTGHVVLPPPALSPDRFDTVVERLLPPRRADPVVEPGRYPLAGWYFDSIGFDAGPMSAIDAVVTVLSGLRSPLKDENQPAALAAMLTRTPFGLVPIGSTPRQLLEALET